MFQIMSRILRLEPASEPQNLGAEPQKFKRAWHHDMRRAAPVSKLLACLILWILQCLDAWTWNLNISNKRTDSPPIYSPFCVLPSPFRHKAGVKARPRTVARRRRKTATQFADDKIVAVRRPSSKLCSEWVKVDESWRAVLSRNKLTYDARN